jgi:benzoyl-CoA 2,3-dioxygenase component B
VLRPRRGGIGDGAIIREDVPALSALNMRLRDDYVEDAAAGVVRWNRVLERAGTAFRITLPHVAFNRRIGEFSAIHTDTSGNVLSREEWHARSESMLPSTDDNLFISSLMHPSHLAGTYAGWIAPPRHGIDNMPGDFEYVQLEA